MEGKRKVRLLLVSDAHGSVENVRRLADEARAADAVLFGGDFARFGAPETGRPVLDEISRLHGTVFAVRGNCDEPGFLGEMDAAGVSVEGALAFVGGLAVAGSGGGTKFSGDTPFERDEEEILSDFGIVRSSSLSEGVPEGACLPLLAIMHNPPKDTDCDVIPGGIHVGSALLRSFVEEFRPLVVLTGHIHESPAVCRVGPSTVVNPGSLAEGRYAVCGLSEDGGSWSVDSAELRTL